MANNNINVKATQPRFSAGSKRVKLDDSAVAHGLVRRVAGRVARHRLVWHLSNIFSAVARAFWELLDWRGLTWVIFVTTVLTAVASAMMLSGRDLSQIGGDLSIRIIIIDSAVLLVVIMLTIGKMWLLAQQYRTERITFGNLSIRMPMFFGTLVFVPTFLMMLFAVTLYEISLDSWFDSRVRSAIKASQVVSQVYLDEKTDAIRLTALSAARDLERNAVQLSDTDAAQDLFSFIARFRLISDAALFRAFSSDQIQYIARVGSRLTIDDHSVTQETLERAKKGEAVTLEDQNGRYRAVLVELTNLPYTYLYIVRYIDTRVTEFASAASEAAMAYDALDTSRSFVQISFTAIFLLNMLLLSLGAVWLGLGTGRHFLAPLHTLITATRKMRNGDTDFNIPHKTGIRELEILGESFKDTSKELSRQRNKLKQTNETLRERQVFIETLLAAVNSGVISLSNEGTIQLANNRASAILDCDINDHQGQPLVNIVPQFAKFLRFFNENGSPNTQEQYLQIKTNQGEWRSVVIHIIARSGGFIESHLTQDSVHSEKSNKKDITKGWVMTIDDLTTLVKAERQSAWADVARRVAHEIKNPLTPIQLAAERILKRTSDNHDLNEPNHKEILNECTQSILRHVEVIQRMVSEFTLYTRTPMPIMQNHDLIDLVRETVFDQKNTDFENTYTFSSQMTRLTVACDRHLIQQALTNVLINARHAHQHRRHIAMHEPKNWQQTNSNEQNNTPQQKSVSPLPKDNRNEQNNIPDTIRVIVEQQGDNVDIIVEDQGLGFGKNASRERFLEPYVSGDNKAGGSGLGLAIVSKIMEDHGGSLLLEDYTDDADYTDTHAVADEVTITGAKVRLRLKTRV